MKKFRFSVMKLIDKDAVVAKVSKRVKEAEIVLRDTPSSAIFGLMQAYKNVLSLLDTLEVRDVDLEKEVNSYMVNEMKFLSDEVGYDTLSTIAKHFYELGLRTKKGV